MTKRIRKPVRCSRVLSTAELPAVRGGPGGNPGTPATDGGVAQMEAMMDQQ
jgi:hypothetical protein